LDVVSAARVEGATVGQGMDVLQSHTHRRFAMKKIMLSVFAVMCLAGVSSLSFAEDMGKMKGDMKGEMKAKHDEMKGEMKGMKDMKDEMKGDMKGEMKAKHDEMKGEMKGMKDMKDEMKGDMKGAMGK
jgi:hypothetical protein